MLATVWAELRRLSAFAKRAFSLATVAQIVRTTTRAELTQYSGIEGQWAFVSGPSAWMIFTHSTSQVPNGKTVVTAPNGFWLFAGIAHPKTFTQTEWHVKPLTGNDDADGLTEQTAIQTAAEFHRRTGIDWTPEVDVDITISEDPPPTNPPGGSPVDHHWRIDGWRIYTPRGQADLNSTIIRQVRFHPGILVAYHSGVFTAVQNMNPATNTPYVVTAQTNGQPADWTNQPNIFGQNKHPDQQLIRITSGPRQNAIAWTANGNTTPGPGVMRTSNWMQSIAFWTGANYFSTPVAVTPQVGDTYEVLSPRRIFVDRIRVKGNGDNWGSGVFFDSFDFYTTFGYDTQQANQFHNFITDGASLNFTNCVFETSSAITPLLPNDSIFYQNCAGIDGVGVLGGGGFAFFYGGCWHLGIFAINARLWIDFDCFMTLGGVTAELGSEINIFALQCWGTVPHGVHGGITCLNGGTVIYTPFGAASGPRIWGIVDGDAGLAIHSGRFLHQGSGAGLTITGSPVKDIVLGNEQTNAYYKDYTQPGGFSAARRTLTWANLFATVGAGGFDGNAFDPPSDASIYQQIQP